MIAWASGPSYGRIMAGLSDVGDENIAGGIAMIERYARLAIYKGLTLALEIAIGRKKA
jgi:hypothetical protein